MNTPQDHKSVDDDKLIADIDRFGWMVMLIEATSYLPSFTYTVGLWKNYNHPELIAFGLTTKTLHSILNIGGELVKSGEALQSGRDYDEFFENGVAQFIQADQRNLNDYFGYAIWFNKTNEFPALQLVWTDRNNKYPWDKNFEKPAAVFLLKPATFRASHFSPNHCRTGVTHHHSFHTTTSAGFNALLPIKIFALPGIETL